LDYLAGTFPVDTSLDDALEFLGAAFQFNGQFFGAAWVPMERGAMGYRSGVANGDIKVFYDGTETMGVHFEMAGKGVKQFLSSCEIKDDAGLQAWLECAVKSQGIVFTRCDWACDDRSQGEPLLDLDVIRKAVDDEAVVSRFKSCEERRKRELGRRRPGARPAKDDAALQADVLYFGSMMSEVCVCFYNKGLEQIQKAKERGDKKRERSLDGSRWVRCELRAKKKRAQALVLEYIQQGVGAVVGVLRDYLDFRVRGSDSNVTRWDRADWWKKFLGECERVRLAVVKPERTIQSVRAWMINQVSPMFSVLCEVSSVQAFVHHLLEEGKARRGARHDFLIACERSLPCPTL
jgi:DNA relaxase NicK